TMADVNVNAPDDQVPTMAPPTHTDDQILPHIRWVPIGKRNCYLDVERSQSNPIFKIAKCQLDEQWFDLTKDTLKDALLITPVDNNNAFSSPQTPDALTNFVNDLERIWEEFTQSIHTFIKDKKNLTQHTQGKKKATLIVIPSVRFTKLIISYLQNKHKFHLRPDSPFHLPNEEPGLVYLKFSAKGTKREVFGIPIPNELITADIQGEQYYKEYLEKIAKHQRYLANEEGSDPDSPAPKPTKATKNSKPSAPKAEPVTKPASAKAFESTSSQQPKPKHAPAKTQEKKRKLVTETSDEPSPTKRSKPGLVTKRRKPTNSLMLVDEFVDKGIPERELSRGGHSLRSLTYVSQERHQGLRDQELWCYRFSEASSIEPILIMQKGCGKNSPNPSIPPLKTKRIWHCIVKGR
nr:E-beta-farnesene synthase [Tanacetum cinerariifolium]